MKTTLAEFLSAFSGARIKRPTASVCCLRPAPCQPSQGRWRVTGSILTLLLLALTPISGRGQSSLHKLPGHNTMKGPSQQAFTGVVQSLDRKLQVLNVTTRHGKDTEIFPIRKGTHVETLGGKRLTLKSLSPGTNVLIYYSESGGERSIRQVIVLEGATGKKKEATKHRS